MRRPRSPAPSRSKIDWPERQRDVDCDIAFELASNDSRGEAKAPQVPRLLFPSCSGTVLGNRTPIVDPVCQTTPANAAHVACLGEQQRKSFRQLIVAFEYETRTAVRNVGYQARAWRASPVNENSCRMMEVSARFLAQFCAPAKIPNNDHRALLTRRIFHETARSTEPDKGRKRRSTSRIILRYSEISLRFGKESSAVTAASSSGAFRVIRSRRPETCAGSFLSSS